MKTQRLFALAALGTSTLAFAQTGTFGSADLSRTVALEARLSPLNENPAVTTRPASGMSTITIRLDRPNTTSAAAVSGSVSVGITATTSQNEVVTAAHIHRGGAGVNGPVVVDFKLGAAANTVANQPASLSTVFEVTEASAVKILEEVIANPAGFYVNVHTESNPGGHIRGQLEPTTSGAVGQLSMRLNSNTQDLVETRRLVIRIAEKVGVITPLQRDELLKALEGR